MVVDSREVRGKAIADLGNQVKKVNDYSFKVKSQSGSGFYEVKETKTVKRKFGETLKSKNPVAQVNELLAKIIAYNLTVVIHEMYENGIDPKFLQIKSDGISLTL